MNIAGGKARSNAEGYNTQFADSIMKGVFPSEGRMEPNVRTRVWRGDGVTCVAALVRG